MKNFPIDELLVTQQSLRNSEQIYPMIEFVKNGGIFSPQELEKFAQNRKINVSKTVLITMFPDGVALLHDGHHRAVAIYNSGVRDYLDSSEYRIEYWTYEDYLDFAPQNNWYTPFDPRTHVRKPDFSEFKKEILDALVGGVKQAESLVRKSLHKYTTPRTIHTVEELSLIVFGKETYENLRSPIGCRTWQYGS